MSVNAIGVSEDRTDAQDKVHGKTKYTMDQSQTGTLFAHLCVSTYAHARIAGIDTQQAFQTPGIRAILTGADCAVLTGSQIEDMPVLARGVVRYCGEPVALVVASEEWQAAQAASRIHITYEPLTVVGSVSDSLAQGAPLIHENLSIYKKAAADIQSTENSNVVNHVKIRKGDMGIGWADCDIVVEGCFSLPQASHAYMETRCATAEISPDGTVTIESSTQAPHAARKLIAGYFNLPEGSIVVRTSYVGGAYGGKVCPHPEMLAYIASRAVKGAKVSLFFTREQSFMSCGCKIGAECRIKAGVKKDGIITAFEAEYHIDTGAYADTGPRMTAAIAANCTGPYAIHNIHCDARCVYTNHLYATSFRGFGHEVSAFCMERMMDKIARALNLNAADVRFKNLARPGDFSPTQVRYTVSNLGDPHACLKRLQEKLNWDEGALIRSEGDKVRAKGIACFSKTSSSPTDASSSAVITFCSDGSVNLNCGVVECGQGCLTVMRQLLAQKLKMDTARIYLSDRIDTRTTPEHWKTVASMTTYLAGKAVLAAAQDAIRQLKRIGAFVLRCTEDALGVGQEKVYLRDDPDVYTEIKNLVSGIKFENGSAFGGPVIGRGSFVMPHLTVMDTETGQGRPGPYWTPGAQGVEIEYDLKEHNLRLLRAITVIDVGKVLSPALAKGQVLGAMNMGLGLATRESLVYSSDGKLQNSSLRTYKPIHFFENPRFEVEFIETANIGAPYGARGLAEHGILGMMPAIANAVSLATGREADAMPLKFETLWKLEGADDPV